MATGEFAATQLEKKRKKWRWKEKVFKRRMKGWNIKFDLLEGSPQGRGIVIEKRGVEARQPNSGIRKCVSPDTKVTLFDGCYTSMKDLKGVWDQATVSSMSLNTGFVEPSKLVDHFSLEENEIKKSYKIKTMETGRELIASSDHPMFTLRGKIDVKDLKIGDKVIVFPSNPIELKLENKTVLTEKDLRKVFFKNSPTKKIIEELKSKELLSLKLNNLKTSKLARLVGHLFGNGCLSYGKAGTIFSGKIVISGKQEEIKEVEKDLQDLGFKVSPLQKMYRERIIETSNGKRKIKGTSYSKSVSSISLFYLFKALGVPVGDKASTEYTVPKWIKKAPLWVKEEFLAAYFGSELEKPRLKNKTFQNLALNVNKTEDKVGSGIKFLNDIKILLKKFGVKASEPIKKFCCIRKDGTKTYRTQLFIKSNHTNLLNLFGKIGYKYSPERAILARHAFQYLTIRKQKFGEYKKAFEEFKKLRREGLSISKIEKALHVKGFTFIKKGLINYWVSRGVKNIDKLGITVETESFNDWRKNASKNLKDGLVWETINEIKEEPVKELMDITTESSNHNFFANGFLTGNCVRVQLIKNGKQLTALAPYDGAIKFIDEHDEVLVEGLGGAQGGPKGDLWGVKYRVTHVNGIALEMLRTGKKEKSKR